MHCTFITHGCSITDTTNCLPCSGSLLGPDTTGFGGFGGFGGLGGGFGGGFPGMGGGFSALGGGAS